MAAESSHVHPHHDQLVRPDGSWIYTNALARETSPYLLQHAHNPVDWHPWGPAAFELARKSNKPIFLSIGYSTCYWCHVMERQVFENPEIAALMNEHFINVKVDREERPDVDDIYMTAVQVLTGHGGWPMSVFLTPPGAASTDDRGLRPFYAGTYFPPEPRHNMPSFPQVVLGLADAWRTRKEEVVSQAGDIGDSITEHLGKQDLGGEVGPELVQATANRLIKGYDPEHGGFGTAPKFPTPVNLLFLLRVFRNNQEPSLWAAIEHTLDRMARGGMYDQIGGGFHRYSTDEKWLVPHFEKMLYDNGQLLETYLIAHRIAPKETPLRKADPDGWLRVVRETCDYVLREMVDKTGAFWSAQDAEVDAREGGNYVWTIDEVRDAIISSAAPGDRGSKAMAELAVSFFGLDLGPNFRDPHIPGATPVNVLFQPRLFHEFASEVGIGVDELHQAVVDAGVRLMAVRDKRKQPGTDDKVITAWNGMMIAGMAMAGRVLGENRYTQAAERAADYILKKMRSSDGGLLRTMRAGEAKIPAFLDDYAFFVHGLLELYRTTKSDRWLTEAETLLGLAAERFAVRGDAGVLRGGYYDTLADQADLFVRTRSMYDGAIASGNSQMVHNWIDLFEVTGNGEFLDRALVDIRAAGAAMKKLGTGMTHMHHALLRAIEAAPQRQASRDAAKPEGTPENTPRIDSSSKPRVLSIDLDHETLDLSSGEASVTVTLNIGPEYHLNANDPGVEGLIATSLELEGGENPGVALTVEYPKPAVRKFDFADQAINVYEGTVQIRATLRKKGATTLPVKLMLTLQLCTEMSCLEPRRVELPVEIVGV